MRKFTLLIIILSFLNLGMASRPIQSTLIKGKVVDSMTSQPIANARISASFRSGTANTSTDAKGNYKVNGPAYSRFGGSNRYILRASKNGYRSKTFQGYLSRTGTNTLNFSLVPLPKPNTPPSIDSVTPANNSTFLAGVKIIIKVNASDPDKDRLRYQFSIGGRVMQSWSTSNTYTWQTRTRDTATVSITCKVMDSRGATVSKDLSYRIIDPSAQDILTRVAYNYARIYDMKADMTLSSTLDGKPFGETEYCRYYFKAPNKEKTESFSDSTRTQKTDIIIINGSTMHLINPVDNIKQQVDLLADAGISSSQFNQMDIYYNQANFLNSHTVTKNDTDTDFNNMIITLDAVPKQQNNLYSKLKLYIDYKKGMLVKIVQNKNDELPQIIEVAGSIQMPNGAWVASKLKKTPNLKTADILIFFIYNNIVINSNLSDIDFNPNKQ